jgi:hypothetical protein
MNKLSLLLILSFLSFSCEKHEITVSGLKGTWVEVDTKTDTIFFNRNNTYGLFILSKGREIRNGYLLPKIESGIFMFELNKDSIAITDGLSCTYSKRNYYFKLNESLKTFNIQTFTTGFEANKAILTFKKLE